MWVTYISQVDSPPDQVGKVGETREISDYLGHKLISTGYAIEAEKPVKSKEKEQASCRKRIVI